MKERESKRGKDEEVNGQGGRGVPRPHTGQVSFEAIPKKQRALWLGWGRGADCSSGDLPAIGNARSPTVEIQIRRSCKDDDDHRQLRLESATPTWQHPTVSEVSIDYGGKDMFIIIIIIIIIILLYTVNHKKGGSTFVTITLVNLDRFL